jgi:pimeloyl-ACP methyl ester carboxylesterase
VLDNKEYTYATTRLDIARAIAARHPDFSVYRVTLDEPAEPDPDAAEDHLGEVFVRSPWGAVVDVVDKKEG